MVALLSEKQRVRAAHPMHQEVERGILSACGCGDCLGLGFLFGFWLFEFFVVFPNTSWWERQSERMPGCWKWTWLLSWKCNILGKVDGFFDVARCRRGLVSDLFFQKHRRRWECSDTAVWWSGITDYGWNNNCVGQVLLVPEVCTPKHLQSS